MIFALCSVFATGAGPMGGNDCEVDEIICAKREYDRAFKIGIRYILGGEPKHGMRPISLYCRTQSRPLPSAVAIACVLW